MVAYVTSTSNGGAHFDFKDQFLRDQAKSEQLLPVKPVIEKFFEGKN